MYFILTPNTGKVKLPINAQNRSFSYLKPFFYLKYFIFCFFLTVNILMVHYLYHMYQLQRGQSFEQCPLKTHISF